MIEFIKTPTFSRMVQGLLSDEAYLRLQMGLIKNPEQGVVLVAGGGIRKLRFSLHAKSKRDGLRVIYYWMKEDGQIFMLLIYPKSKHEDLTSEQISTLKEFVKGLK